MDSEAVTQWCKEQGVDPDHCAVLELPEPEWAEDKLDQLARELSKGSRCHAIDQRKGVEGHPSYGLFEWRAAIPQEFRVSVIHLTGAQRYTVIKPKCPEERNGAGVSENQSPGNSTPPSGTTTADAQVVQKLCETIAEMFQKVPTMVNTNYRRLRCFSGKEPIPQGEEDFEAWLSQAGQSITEWDVTDSIKRQRVMESLKGPAAEVIYNLKLSNNACTVEDYMDALTGVFGEVEKLSDLRHRFEHTHQKVGEKLSDFLHRLDRLLRKLVQKKGVAPEDVNKVRFQQVLYGALPVCPIVWKFRLRGSEEAPEYSSLLREIREEEAVLLEKQQIGGMEKENKKAFAGPMQTDPTNEELPGYTKETEPPKVAQEMLERLLLAVENKLSIPPLAEAKLNACHCHCHSSASPTAPESQKDVAFSSTRNCLEDKSGGLHQLRCFECGEKGHIRTQCSKRLKPKKSQLNDRGHQ